MINWFSAHHSEILCQNFFKPLLLCFVTLYKFIFLCKEFSVSWYYLIHLNRFTSVNYMQHSYFINRFTQLKGLVFTIFAASPKFIW